MKISHLALCSVVFAIITSCHGPEKKSGDGFVGKTSEHAPDALRTVLYKNVHVVDIPSRTIHYNQCILTKGDVIEAVMPSEKSGLPEADTIIECHDSYVIPSLADLHHHLTPSDFDFRNWTTERQGEIARNQVKFGIQAILNPNNTFESSSYFMRHKDGRAFPYLFYTGPSLCPEGGWGNHPVRTTDEIDRAIDSIQSLGGTYVKFTYDDMSWLGDERPVLDTALIEHLLARGHEKKMKVLAHVTSSDEARFLIEKGVDGIIHGIISETMSPALLDLMKKENVFYIPTTVLYETCYHFKRSVTEQFKYDIWNHYPQALKDSLSNEASQNTWNSWWPRARELSHLLPNVYENTKLAHDHGIRVVLGSDTGTPGVLPGISTLYELALLERSGLDPYEVLECAIVNPLEILGLSEKTGRIASGMKANMIFLTQNPTESMEHIKSSWLITYNGKIVSHRAN